MSAAANGSAIPGDAVNVTDPKGKGKQVVEPSQSQSHDMSMDEDEDSSDESGAEEPVSIDRPLLFFTTYVR